MSSITEVSTQKSQSVENVEESNEKDEGEGERNPPKAGAWRRPQQVQLFKRPFFTGVNPDSWLFRAERYFEIHQLSEWEKITETIISFDEYVVDWYQWPHNRKIIKS